MSVTLLKNNCAKIWRNYCRNYVAIQLPRFVLLIVIYPWREGIKKFFVAHAE